MPDKYPYAVPSLPPRKPETEEERKARQADFFRRLKSLPGTYCEIDLSDREAFRKSIK